MNIQVQRTYSEVYGILNMMGKYYIKKIPTKLYQMIEKERDKNYLTCKIGIVVNGFILLALILVFIRGCV